MKYQREINHSGIYRNITIIDDEGNYEQFNEWGDGTRTCYFRTKLYKMGWSSVKEFLKEKNNFVKVVIK